MSEIVSQSRARLIVIAGRPGSGKTTLAHALAFAIRCPAISRDEIKEGVVNSLMLAAVENDAMQRHANETFFQVAEFLLRKGVTLVIEAAFQHKLWAPRLEPLLAVAQTRVIVCTVDPELARSRHIQRGLADPERERFHGDAPVQAAREGHQLPIGDYDPPRFDVPTLIVETTDGYDPSFEQIVSFVSPAC